MSKNGFTLAEVLITLGVIGIVAAITMPNLIKKYQQHVMLNKLKSTYTILNNSLELSKPEYGTDVNGWYLPDGDYRERGNYFFNTYMKPHLKVAKTVPSGVTHSDKIYLANGVMIDVRVPQSGEDIQASRVQVFIYLEPTKGDNQKRNNFMVELGGGTGGAGKDRNKFWPYGYSKNPDRNLYLNGCAGKGESNQNYYCLALIFYDGWQIAPDYPW